jgi:hypothetical protein
MQIVKDDETGATVVPGYDPSKKYTWHQDAQFILSGNEFGMLLNSLRGIVSTPEARVILRAADAADAIESIMAKAVESGLVVEYPEQ